MTTKNGLLTNAALYTENGVIEKGYIKWKDGFITETGSMAQLTDSEGLTTYELTGQHKLVPGMIDVHIHGVNGADTMDATADALQTMAEALPREGTTSFLATTITQSREATEAALSNAGAFIARGQKAGQAEIAGVHLEGPFLNKGKAGAQPLQHITDPDTELFRQWQELSGGVIRLVTLAPEQDGAEELIHHLKENKVIASIGHSDATYEQVQAAVKAGLSHVTHLYNQMSGLHHREPGVVGAALLHDELMVEIISDGIHVRPEALRLAYRQKTAEKLVLITDAMRAKCLKSGSYDLGGQQVTVGEGKAVLEDGTLAGSILKMGKAFQNIMAFTDCTIEEAIQMSSVNPAKELGMYDRKGSLTPGKEADIVVLDDNHEVYMTFCRGVLAFEKGEGKQ